MGMTERGHVKNRIPAVRLKQAVTGIPGIANSKKLYSAGTFLLISALFATLILDSKLIASADATLEILDADFHYESDAPLVSDTEKCSRCHGRGPNRAGKRS